MYGSSRRAATLIAALPLAWLVLSACVPASYWVPTPAEDQAMPGTLAPTTPATALAIPDPTEGHSSPAAQNLSSSGHLRLAVREMVASLNPYAPSNEAETFVASLLYDTLLQPGADGSLTPNLARRWELGVGGTELRVWLNPQARWHDGRPVTVEDVVHSFALIRSWGEPGWGRVAALLDRVEIVTPEEIRFLLLAPQSDALRLIGAGVPITPFHIWSALESPRDFLNLEAPVGSGPFRLAESVSGERLVLENTASHHTSPPQVQTLAVEIVRDEDRALTALVQDELDAIGWPVTPELAQEVLSQPDRYAGIRVAQTAGQELHLLLFNLRHAPYDDVAFRRALWRGLDMRGIAEQVWLGFADAGLDALFPASSQWPQAAVSLEPFQLAAAPAGLTLLGFRDADSDGQLEQPDGTPLVVDIACLDLDVPLQIARLIGSQMGSMGIGNQVRPVSQDAWISTLAAGDFDLAIQSASLHSPETAYLLFHSSLGTVVDNRVVGPNYGGYASAEFDELVTAYCGEADPAKQSELASAMETRLLDDLPVLPLASPRVLSLFRTARFREWRSRPGYGCLHRETVMHLVPVRTDQDS